LKDATDRQSAQRRGHAAKTVAALWLRLKGYRILARRLKTRGEIDLVAAAPFGPVCSVESKRAVWREPRRNRWARPSKTRIARAASLYLASRPGLARRGSRFDIVAIAPHVAAALPGCVAARNEAFMH